jgi:hypothetical protein
LSGKELVGLVLLFWNKDCQQALVMYKITQIKRSRNNWDLKINEKDKQTKECKKPKMHSPAMLLFL